MAKRRRLEAPTSPMEIAMGRASPAPPPIAQVTGEAATVAAAEAALDEVERARAEGRMVVSLPIAEIARDHLTRDRLRTNDEDMDALTASIRAHGQRTPIEVVALDEGYGLISGWRRLNALDSLGKTHVEALIRNPVDAGAAYVAMVEENEIRVGLSYYERARIAVMAAARGAFEDTEEALSSLYASASRAKRSKIRSFVSLVDALDDRLQFPGAIPERLGLKIASALKEGKAAVLKQALKTPAKTAEAEAAALTRAMADPKAKPAVQKEILAPNLVLELKGAGASRRAVLSGAGLTDAKLERLKEVLGA